MTTLEEKLKELEDMDWQSAYPLRVLAALRLAIEQRDRYIESHCDTFTWLKESEVEDEDNAALLAVLEGGK